MNEFVRPIAEWCAAGVELLGLAIIILFATVSLIMGVVLFIKGHAKEDVFSNVRQVLGQGILLGLEFLIAADIIHTVAVELTFESIGVLALVVLIRTSLVSRWIWNSPGAGRGKTGHPAPDPGPIVRYPLPHTTITKPTVTASTPCLMNPPPASA